MALINLPKLIKSELGSSGSPRPPPMTPSRQDADVLVVEVMRVRGYPVEDFDRRTEDISVDHPDVVRHWRWGPTR